MLMFIVFIPWKDCEGYSNLEKSAKLIHKFELKPKNHRYFEWTSQKYKLMSNFTYILVLSTNLSAN